MHGAIIAIIPMIEIFDGRRDVVSQFWYYAMATMVATNATIPNFEAQATDPIS